MHGVAEERRLVTLDEVAQPGQRERRGDQEQSDDPVKPDYDQGGEAHGNCDRVQSPVHGVTMRPIVVRQESHAILRNGFQHQSAAPARRPRPQTSCTACKAQEHPSRSTSMWVTMRICSASMPLASTPRSANCLQMSELLM